MKVSFHKIGAICYMLWGVLHVAFGALVLYRLGTEGGTAALGQIGSAVPRGDLPTMTGVASGVLAQHSGNLIVFGLFALVVGMLWNWRNRRLGYWLNLAVVSGADLSFVLAIVVPRYDTWVDGLAGPILWILGAIFSTLGIVSAKEEH
jgi:hypothetical protein